MDILKSLKDTGAYSLATLVGVSSPDNVHSEGAEFLKDIRDDFLDRLANETDGDTLSEKLDEFEGLGFGWDIADNAIPTNTYEMWLVFTDLELYQEDRAMDWEGSMHDGCVESLMAVAQTLIQVLIGDIRYVLASE